MSILDQRVMSKVRGRRLTRAAGWIAIAFGAVHVVVAPIDTRDTWSRVLDDGWWNTFTLDKATTLAELQRSEAFWVTLGSFGVPILLLGCWITWTVRQGGRVPEWLGWATIAWSLLLTTAIPASPAWALLAVGVLIVVGDRLAISSPAGLRARTTE